MARMYPFPIPAKAVEDPFRSAERRVYQALAESLPKATAVFYSAAWLGRPRSGPPVDGEADFVVADPDRGLLVLEVKGGGIARDGATGQWLSRDRTGHVHTIKDPLEQAVRAKHALLAKLKELPGFPGWVDAGHGVVLPDSRRSPALLGPAAPPDIVAFAEDMGRLGERVHDMIRFWGGGAARHGLGGSGVDALVRYLAPSFELPLPAGPALEEDDRAILRLTEEQFSVLDLLSRLRRVAVTGGAGTGKTILAREKARRLAAEGFRTLLTCASAPLAAALAAQCRGVPNLTVECFAGFCRRLARRAGFAPPAENACDEALGAACLEALDRVPEERYEAIIVDEGQDFAEDRWDLLRLALADEAQGILYVFYDDNQRLRPECSRFLASLPAVTLTKNLRNTRTIYGVAEPFFACGSLQPAGPEGRPVEYVSVNRPADAEREVAKVLRRLLREELVPPEHVAVLTGEHSALGAEGSIGAFECAPAAEKGKVVLSSVPGFKGLESRVAVLAGLEEVLDSPEALYVALTRARTHLIVVGTDAALASLRSRKPGELVCRTCQ